MALRKRLVRGEHAETPEGEASSHGEIVVGLFAVLVLLGVVLEVDVGGDRGGQLARGHLEEAEVRGSLETVADHDELNLGQDEAVAAAVFAHHVVQVSKALEILDLLDITLNAHASVEAVKGLDQANNAGGRLATKDGGSGGGITGNGGNEHLLSVLGSVRSGLGRNGQLQGTVGGQSQSSVELGQVVIGVDGMQSSLGLGVTLRAHGVRQEGLGHRAGDESSSCARRQGHERRGVEGGPGADLADIPPEVLNVRIPQREGDGAHQRWSRVGGGEVVQQSCGVGRLNGGRLKSLNLLRHWLRLRGHAGGTGHGR